MRQEKRKKRGEEKAKSKSQDCCVTLKPMLSAHARTSQANILHVDQKAVKCMRGRGEIPDSLFFIQLHSQGLSLPHCRGEGERSQTPYSSYSFILRVFHCPTREGIGERPQTLYPTYSLIQSETKIELDLRLHSQGLSLPHSRGKGERPQTLYSSYSL